MRLVTFTHPIPFRNLNQPRVGALVQHAGRDQVVDLTRIDSLLPADMRSFLAAGPWALALAAELSAQPPATAMYALETVQLKPVVPDPGKIICIGLNYRDHAAETKHPLPATPTVFAKYANTLVGAGGPITLPRATRQIDYAAELAVVIGRRGKHIPEANALQYVAGYTIFNDVSARDEQFQTNKWTIGTTFDTFAPLGPALVTVDEVLDPHDLHIQLSIGDELLQDGHTSEMIFSIPRLITYLSTGMTLEPGDVIATGTPASGGATRHPPRFLRPGDTVRITIERLGVLENPVVGEQDTVGRLF